MWWEPERWCRVGVVNKSKSAVAENVEVQLVEFSPEPADPGWFNVLPCRLGRKDAHPGQRHNESIRINPGDTVYFDVLRGIRPAVVLWTVLPTSRNGQVNPIELEEDKEYRLTIKVSASNQLETFPPTQFGVRWPSDGDVCSLEFYPIDSATNQHHAEVSGGALSEAVGQAQ